jgi:hypothetical protein
VVAIVAVVVVSGASQRAGRQALTARVLAAFVPAGAVILLARQDHHGASLLFGVAVGALMLTKRG